MSCCCCELCAGWLPCVRCRLVVVCDVSCGCYEWYVMWLLSDVSRGCREWCVRWLMRVTCRWLLWLMCRVVTVSDVLGSCYEWCVGWVPWVKCQMVVVSNVSGGCCLWCAGWFPWVRYQGLESHGQEFTMMSYMMMDVKIKLICSIPKNGLKFYLLCPVKQLTLQK